jgi:ATP-dependent Lon protease
MKTALLVLPARDHVLLPGALRALQVGRPASLAAIDQHLDHDAPLVIVPQVDPAEEDALAAHVARVGCVARVLQITELPDNQARVLVEGLGRAVRISDVDRKGDVFVATFEEVEEPQRTPATQRGLARELLALHREFLQSQGFSQEEQDVLAPEADAPGRVADHIASALPLSWNQRVQVLEAVDIEARLAVVSDQLATAVAQQRIQAEVHAKVQAAMDQNQKEYHLKEQLKVIRTELGDAAGPEGEADALEAKIKELDLPDEVRTEVLREISRMRRIGSDSAEYNIARTWVETICEFPWSKSTVDDVSLARAEEVLDEDHYGLRKIKERIVEYLAVRQLRADARGAILCFVGAPGVGKTSLGKSIARALGRSFGRVSLGGIKDESEIRGHRRTYVGALPGRIVRAMIRAGTRNPVLVLDEIDKLGADFRGDPSSALLEVLDPEQNNAFSDHYMDVPVDLSQVLFIATANLTDPIPSALADRFEILSIPGYTEEEKLQIATRFLAPRLAAEHGLKPEQVALTQAAIEGVIEQYTREAGLRNFSRKLASMYRKAARRVVEGTVDKVIFDAPDLESVLGPPDFDDETADEVLPPGVATGLAWTEAGGEILFIECLRTDAPAGLKLTGSLGDVMKESTEAALSWLRANASRYDIPPDAFAGQLHLHVPAGAIPKDGPSAGVGMVSALASLASGRPIRRTLAMTGEITLRGRVLKIGGVKEKVLAARRRKRNEVILPASNRAEVKELPPEVLADMTFHYVETIDDVLRIALTA